MTKVDHHCSLHHAHQPRFPIRIQDHIFKLVLNMLNQLNYHGPLALSCDNTKLLASLCSFYDKKKKAWFVLGHVGAPYQLLDYEDFQTVTNTGGLQKARKVRERLWAQVFIQFLVLYSSIYFACRFQCPKSWPLLWLLYPFQRTWQQTIFLFICGKFWEVFLNITSKLLCMLLMAAMLSAGFSISLKPMQHIVKQCPSGMETATILTSRLQFHFLVYSPSQTSKTQSIFWKHFATTYSQMPVFSLFPTTWCTFLRSVIWARPTIHLFINMM